MLSIINSGIVILCVVMIFMHHRWSLRQMDAKLREMRAIQDGMREMLAAPERIRAAAKEIRDTITRVQMSDHNPHAMHIHISNQQYGKERFCPTCNKRTLHAFTPVDGKPLTAICTVCECQRPV